MKKIGKQNRKRVIAGIIAILLCVAMVIGFVVPLVIGILAQF